MLYWAFIIYLVISLSAFVLLMAIIYVGRGDPLPPEPLAGGGGTDAGELPHQQTNELQLR